MQKYSGFCFIFMPFCELFSRGGNDAKQNVSAFYCCRKERI